MALCLPTPWEVSPSGCCILLAFPRPIGGPTLLEGRGLLFYRHLGLPADEVCEIGKWKSTEAFDKHYSRLGATKSARVSLERFVHNVSPGDCAEPDQSRTPVTMEEPGGSDWEGEAHEPGEPTLPPLTSKRRQAKRPRSPPAVAYPELKFQFATPRSQPSSRPKQ